MYFWFKKSDVLVLFLKYHLPMFKKLDTLALFKKKLVRLCGDQCNKKPDVEKSDTSWKYGCIENYNEFEFHWWGMINDVNVYARVKLDKKWSSFILSSPPSYGPAGKSKYSGVEPPSFSSGGNFTQNCFFIPFL